MSDILKIVKTTPVFQKNLAAFNSGKYAVISNAGGSRSGKTYSIIQLLIGVSLQRPNIRISIVSHSLPHIKRGAFRDFKEIMTNLNLFNDDDWRATDFVYTFENGSYIEFFGIEDPGRARGPGRDILFVNEANLVQKEIFDQLAMRTRGQILIDYNPADFVSWVYPVSDNPKNKTIHSTYLDNIHNLSQAQIDYIESYKDLPDQFMWKVYGLGQRGASAELIYTNYKVVDKLPEGGDVIFGLDFGYNNPSALVKLVHYDGEIYMEEIIYQTKLTTNDLADRLKSLNIPRGTPIYCDAAEPKSIEELFRMGVNAKPAAKDVYAGILFMKSKAMYVTANSKNLIAELQSYKWKKNKNDEIMEEPVKESDHALDAARYAAFTHISKPTRNILFI